MNMCVNYVKLLDVSKVIMGQSPPSETYNLEKIGLPFFQGKAEFGQVYPKAKVYCSNPSKIAEPYDVLMSVRAPVGDVNLSNTKCCIGRGLAAIRPNKKFITYRYLYYLLSYKKIK